MVLPARDEPGKTVTVESILQLDVLSETSDDAEDEHEWRKALGLRFVF